MAGVTIPRTSQEQWRQLTRVDVKDIGADALLAQQPQHRHQRGRLHREGVQHGRARRHDRVERRPQLRRRLPDSGDVQQPDDRAVGPEQPLFHRGLHRLVPPGRPPGAGAVRLFRLDVCAHPSSQTSTAPPRRRPDVLTSSIHEARM
ncbi:hypothetical protein SVIOM74S_07518 [Streptomyces violarus]